MLTATQIRVETRLVQIPASDFLMGSETGQDCERPIHRVWIERISARRNASHQRAVRPLPRLDRNHAPTVLATTPTSTIRSSQWPEFHGMRQFVIANG